MNFKVAICSYKRTHILQQNTLSFLKKNNIPSDCIDIFVANEEEYEVYKNEIPEDLYNDLIIAKLGYHNVKNFIMKYYPENSFVWHLDDDIEDIKILGKDGLESITESKIKLINIVKYAFSLLRKHRTNLIGMYPVDNDYFMSNDIGKGLYFCIGNCFWTINSHSPDLTLVLSDKTDYELNIKSYLKNGCILRFNNMVAVTDYDNIDGGTSTYRTLELQEKVGKYLISNYPELCEENTHRSRDNFEIKFRRQKGNSKIKF